MTKQDYDMLIQIIQDCQEVQNSNESDFTKEHEKIVAYDEIYKLLKGKI